MRRTGRLRLLVMLGGLVRTTAGKWITRPPSRCSNVHALGPNQVLVGHVACLGHGAADTPVGIAAPATPPCTGRRSTLTAPHSKGLPKCGFRPDALIDRWPAAFNSFALNQAVVPKVLDPNRIHDASRRKRND
jgi:hypothetical protein